MLLEMVVRVELRVENELKLRLLFYIPILGRTLSLILEMSHLLLQ